MNTPKGIVAYATYLPRHRLRHADLGAALGTGGGTGSRVAASFDEDSTTLGIEAARRLPRGGERPGAIFFATTSPAYLDKTNAAAVHAALGLGADGFAVDLAGSARSGTGALLAAAASGGLAVLADVRTGLPGSADERDGADGAAAFLFGDPDEAIAEIVARVSVTAEFLDRWRTPDEPAARRWEERFGLESYLPLVTEAGRRALAEADVAVPDHVVLSSPNPLVARRGAALFPARVPAGRTPGHAGAADVGLSLAEVLDRAAPGETVLLLAAVDGCDALVLRATDRIEGGRQAHPISAQLAAGRDVSYTAYLTWRGLLDREAPRRPEPEVAAGPPSARSQAWKFAFTGSRCRGCGFVHLPPARVCKGCGAVDEMEPRPLSGVRGTVVTFTADRLAYSPSPPLIDVVVDFDGGGRYTMELADAAPDEVEIGMRVETTFRRLHTTQGVHNYFWKARPVEDER
ncbi:OB-fold domain-containing protein [Streptosporangium sp. NBC_01755]|uniref:OB-fold domain-containing protein n=1 Tax=Streptosporangium sp. NBC_01755 TaxID=2975949 RepID=UPI002DD89DF0|nr:OB-fold domain-containing protein [Streptosporangium sp. NBC_01755]WSC99573.1 OB-fold domain-containing protein [Streptosporangium sp. NBC_01755]